MTVLVQMGRLGRKGDNLGNRKLGLEIKYGQTNNDGVGGLDSSKMYGNELAAEYYYFKHSVGVYYTGEVYTNVESN